jgi:hypothetical protein
MRDRTTPSDLRNAPPPLAALELDEHIDRSTYEPLHVLPTQVAPCLQYQKGKLIHRPLRRIRVDRGERTRMTDVDGAQESEGFSDVERGSRNPTITVVEKIAPALEAPLGQLLN